MRFGRAVGILMRGSAPRAVRPRMIVSDRWNHLFALALFLVAYVGILAVTFAPQGMFVAPPPNAQVGK